MSDVVGGAGFARADAGAKERCQAVCRPTGGSCRHPATGPHRCVRSAHHEGKHSYDHDTPCAADELTSLRAALVDAAECLSSLQADLMGGDDHGFTWDYVRRFIAGLEEDMREALAASAAKPLPENPSDSSADAGWGVNQ